MNDNMPDIENVTDAVSDEYKKTKKLYTKLISDLKKARFRSDISMGFSMPGKDRCGFERSCDTSAVKAGLMIAAAAVLLFAIVVFHLKMMFGKKK